VTFVTNVKTRLTQPIGGGSVPATGAPKAKTSRSGRRRSLGLAKLPVGLDIQASGVRAVQMSSGRGRPTLERVGEVALPPGAVLEGEVVDVDAVGRAIRELWTKGRFTSTSVVVGVTTQRAVVRVVEVPAMTEGDFRQAIKFEAAEHLPIAVDEAVLDFRIMDSSIDVGLAPAGPTKMRVMLMAAHRASIDGLLAAVKAGGLNVAAVDVGGLALARSVVTADPLSVEPRAVVDVGSDLTTVAATSAGYLQFLRVLSGGAPVGEASASPAPDRPGTTEGLLRGLASDRPEATSSASEDALVGQIVASIQYAAGQADLRGLRRVTVTGSGLERSDTLQRLRESLPYSIELADPFENVEVDTSALAPALSGLQVAGMQTAIGLAYWGLRTDRRRLTLLPDEVVSARRQRKAATYVTAAGLVVAVALGSAWYARDHGVSSVKRQAAAIEAQTSIEQGRATRLGVVTQFLSTVNSRKKTVDALAAGDVNWPLLLQEIAQGLPPGLTLSQISVSEGTAIAGATGSAAPSAVGDTVSMNVVGTGTDDQAATFLRSIAKVKALGDVVVPSESSSNGQVAFSASAVLTSHAPIVPRGSAK
jgi:type IV pilus assembly protein PilM